jgi:hypothetical protein
VLRDTLGWQIKIEFVEVHCISRVFFVRRKFPSGMTMTVLRQLRGAALHYFAYSREFQRSGRRACVPESL